MLIKIRKIKKLNNEMYLLTRVQENEMKCSKKTILTKERAKTNLFDFFKVGQADFPFQHLLDKNTLWSPLWEVLDIRPLLPRPNELKI
jgi:hypothetical protein